MSKYPLRKNYLSENSVDVTFFVVHLNIVKFLPTRHFETLLIKIVRILGKTRGVVKCHNIFGQEIEILYIPPVFKDDTTTTPMDATT